MKQSDAGEFGPPLSTPCEQHHRRSGPDSGAFLRSGLVTVVDRSEPLIAVPSSRRRARHTGARPTLTRVDIITLFRRFGPRLSRWPVQVGCVVGSLVAWGLAHTRCAFKLGGGQCAFSLPGESRLVGQLLWGLLAAVVTTLALWLLRRPLSTRDSGGKSPSD